MNTQRPIAALILAGALAALASSKNAVLNASNVTIVSIDAYHLVVSRTAKGKTEQMLFIVDSNTVRKGRLTVGSPVTVHYTTKNHENIATSIQSRDSSSTPHDALLPR